MPLKIDHVTLLARSLPDSMAYYGALLPLIGFARVKDHIWTDGEGFYFQFMAAKGETRDYERYGPGMNHLGFAAPDVATVERVRAGMAAAGFAVPDIQQLGPVTALFMKDPDGVRFEISHTPAGVAPVD